MADHPNGMNTLLCANIGKIVRQMDELVGYMIERCEFEGRSYCEWTTALQHQYMELRHIWEAGGGDPSRENLRLTNTGTINLRGPICAVPESHPESPCLTSCWPQ